MLSLHNILWPDFHLRNWLFILTSDKNVSAILDQLKYGSGGVSMLQKLGDHDLLSSIDEKWENLLQKEWYYRHLKWYNYLHSSCNLIIQVNKLAPLNKQDRC